MYTYTYLKNVLNYTLAKIYISGGMYACNLTMFFLSFSLSHTQNYFPLPTIICINVQTYKNWWGAKSYKSFSPLNLKNRKDV